MRGAGWRFLQVQASGKCGTNSWMQRSVFVELAPRCAARLVLLGLFASIAAWAAEPPVAKAKVEEPVLQELMGGCSLKCGFAWSVEVRPAEGQKSATVEVLNDESADTAWSA